MSDMRLKLYLSSAMGIENFSVKQWLGYERYVGINNNLKNVGCPMEVFVFHCRISLIEVYLETNSN